MTRAFGTLGVALTVVTGCMAGHAAHTQPPAASAQAADTAPGGMTSMAMPACPMSVPGTRVVAADTADGESLTFTTTPDAAPELRTRVRAMAETHNRHHATAGMGGMQGMRHGAMPHEAMPPPSRATVEDLDYGARILLTPVDPADVERLRSTVRLHAQRMQESGTCEMGPAAHE